MNTLFLTVLNQSLSASILVLVVLGLRVLLKQSPKWISLLLWALVAVRLLCPVSMESPLSLMPQTDVLLNEWADDYVGDVEIIHENTDGYDRAIDAGRLPIAIEEGSSYVVTAPDRVSAPATVETDILPGLTWLWLCGMALLGLYVFVSTLRLRRRVNTAVLLRGNIYQSQQVDTPFVLGIFRPKIYLPFAMSHRDMRHVIAHEQAHLRRGDQLWKALGFALLMIHWFNPLLWLGYSLMCRDMELACDEAVIKALDNDGKADYAQALLTCSIHPRTAIAYPLAFGEVGIKERVASVAAYKKPGVWIVALSVLVCAAVGICFLTTPADADTPAPDIGTPGARLGELMHYLELSCPETEFENMQTERMDELLNEYGDLLDGFSMIGRQTTDERTCYILGVWDEKNGSNPLIDIHTMGFSGAGSTEQVDVLYHKDDSEAVDLALMNGEQPENAYIIKDSWIYNASADNLFLIMSRDNHLTMTDALRIYLYTPNGKAYIEGAAERGVSITAAIPPYLEFYLISPEYGEISETIQLTPQEAADILKEPRKPLKDGYGMSVFMEWDDTTRFYEKSGIPPTVLKLAVERCGYEFLTPADITGEITEARLDCSWLDAPVFAQESDLPRLREILVNAEQSYVGGCGYDAKLILSLSDGKQLTLFKGCDGCDSMVFGSYGGYSIGDTENTEFWNIFGLDLETKQPVE